MMRGWKEIMLSVNNVDAFYGKVQALFDINLDVKEGEIVSIIGANGAGKSTLMRCIMGILHPRNGKVIYKGKDITRLRTDQIVSSGIVYIPEGREIFPNLSVEENLEMGAYSKKYSRKKFKLLLDEMYDIYPILGERRKQLAGSLSGGEQQMLAIARGMMSEPEMMMFDEPSLGLAPVIVDEMFETIVKINKTKGIPILLVEQNAFAALSISNRCYVLETGEIKTSGLSTELIKSPEIKKAYLGG